MTQSPFDALFNAAADGIIVINDKGIIEQINTAAKRLFGYEERESIGQNISLFMPEPDRSRHDSYIDQYLRTGVRKMIGIGRKTKGRKKGGVYFPMYLSVGQIDEGESNRFVGIVHDLTEEEQSKKYAEQSATEVQLLREKLVHVSRVSTLGEMATGIAHEINQPLTAIATYAQACQRLIRSNLNEKDGSIDADVLIDALDKIASQAERASKVITGVRQLSKQQAMICSDHNCSDLIIEVVALVQTYSSQKNIKIKMDIDDLSKNISVSVDNIQTQQVLLNLLNNGIESMCSTEVNKDMVDSEVENKTEGRDTILVKVRKRNDAEVEVSVIDQGQGIDEGNMTQMFDTFYTTKPSGLGMGLSISQSIISAQGGKISCSKNERYGSTFTISLPISVGC